MRLPGLDRLATGGFFGEAQNRFVSIATRGWFDIDVSLSLRKYLVYSLPDRHQISSLLDRHQMLSLPDGHQMLSLSDRYKMLSLPDRHKIEVV